MRGHCLLRQHKALHLAQHHHETALQLVEMILELIPESAAELLDRARLREVLQQPEAAAADYLHYLESNPDSVTRDDLYQRMQLLLACPQTVH